MANFNQRRIDQILARGREAASTTARGRACEDLGGYIFGKFAGVKQVGRNVLDAFGAAETDLVFTNDSRLSGLYFLEPVVIVECKNYSMSNVSAQEVTYFAARLQQKGARSGVMLTTTTISGGQGVAGVHAIEAALVQGVSILVVDAEVISSLTTTQDLTSTLMGQMVALRMRGTPALS